MRIRLILRSGAQRSETTPRSVTLVVDVFAKLGGSALDRREAPLA